jgi:hypothetical protein
MNSLCWKGHNVRKKYRTRRYDYTCNVAVKWLSTITPYQLYFSLSYHIGFHRCRYSTNSGDVDIRNLTITDHKTVHKTYLNTLGVPYCHIAMGIFVHFSLNWTPWHLVLWPLEHNCPNQSDSQIANINITTICTIYMLLDVIWSCVR